jgi:hypothetical protein
VKLAILILLPALGGAAILPETVGAYHRTAVSAPALADNGVWEEYGLKDSESATYEHGKERFTAAAYRLQDTTAALAAFDWQRPPDARPSNLASLAAETAEGVVLAHGNYLFSFQGYKPSAAELAAVLDPLRNVDSTPLPTLPGFLPSRGLISNSERYILGPASLQKFDAGIPPSVAAFHLGAEAQIGAFRTGKGNTTLAIFNYPTPQIAMGKEQDFQKIAGAMVKRTGPLVAVILSPADPDGAERLLAQVRYEAQVTLTERTPTSVNQIGRMLFNIFLLTGILVVFSIIAGLFVGGFRTFVLRGRGGRAEDPMILLHLEQR